MDCNKNCLFYTFILFLASNTVKKEYGELEMGFGDLFIRYVYIIDICGVITAIYWEENQ